MQKRILLSLIASTIFFSNDALSEQTQSSNITVLSAVTVEDDEYGYIYYQDKSTSATKTDTPLRETPQSVQIVSKEVIEDLGAVNIQETLNYVSGVSNQNNFGGMWDNFAIRGFAGHENTGMSLLKNGFSDNRGFNAPRDTANIESIEFLKGPSAALYGNSEPGGTINIVTKQPKFTTANEIEATVGSNDYYRLAADTTGAVNEKVALRLNAAVEDKNSFRDYVESKRYVFAPSLVWVINDDTYLTYVGEYIKQEAPMDRGIAAVNGNTKAIDSSVFLGNPNDGNMTLENYTNQLKLTHTFSDNWSGNAGIAYKRNTLEGTFSEIKPFVNVTSDSVLLRTRYRDYLSDDISFQGELKNVSDLGEAKNTFLIGTEAYRFESNSVMYNLNNSVSVSNIYTNPVYTTLLTGQGTKLTDLNETHEAIALFAQDEIGIGNWRFLAGLRYDQVTKDTLNNLNDSTTNQNDYAVSPRVGITYLIDSQWSVYGTSGKSFRPNTGVDVDGNSFEAEEGLSFETGLKYESLDKRLGATLSLYQIDKTNVLTGSDASGVYSVAAGEVRSRGFELDVTGKVTDKFKLNASYSYIDAEVTKDNGGVVDWWSGEVVNLEGKELSNVAKHNASLLGMWEDTYLGKNYGFGSGINYVGQRQGNYVNSFTLPSYTTVKLISYVEASKDLTFKLDVNNLFDKEYIVSSYDRAWLTPGEYRSFKLTMNYKF